uniref:CSON009417 protein n=1 Tax=Culicoides sonorensis TaxID=179676 RepID=A0A336M0S2_CULSO
MSQSVPGQQLELNFPIKQEPELEIYDPILFEGNASVKQELNYDENDGLEEGEIPVTDDIRKIESTSIEVDKKPRCPVCEQEVKSLKTHLFIIHKIKKPGDLTLAINRNAQFKRSLPTQRTGTEGVKKRPKIDDKTLGEKESVQQKCPICGAKMKHIQFHFRLVHKDVMTDPKSTFKCIFCHERVSVDDIMSHTSWNCSSLNKTQGKKKPAASADSNSPHFFDTDKQSEDIKCSENASHRIRNYKLCPICIRITKRLRVHAVEEHNELLQDPTILHNCLLCNQSFQTSDLVSHTYSKNCLLRRRCLSCKKIFTTYRENINHMTLDHNMMHCFECDRWFNEQDFDRHLRNQHNMINKFERDEEIKTEVQRFAACGLCSYNCEIAHLWNHIKECHNDTQENDYVYCHICEKYMRKQTFVIHAETSKLHAYKM